MLIIGDVATKAVNPNHKVKEVEIIFHDDDELDFIKEKYGLDVPTYNSNIYEINQDGLRYILYNKNIHMVLSKIMKDARATKFKSKIANPYITFVFNASRLRHHESSLPSWIRTMESFNFLKEKYIAEVATNSPKYLRIMEKTLGLLTPFYPNRSSIRRQPYQYDVFTDEEERMTYLSIVTTSANITYDPYYILTNDPLREFREEQFNKFSEAAQLRAIMGLLYIDVLIEYIIPLAQDFNHLSSEDLIFEEFLRAIMNRASQEKDNWLSEFVIINFDELVNTYSGYFIATFNKAVKENLLDFTIYDNEYEDNLTVIKHTYEH